MTTKKKARPRRRTKTSGKSLPGKITSTINGFPVRKVKVSDLHAAAYNPREISEAALEGLKRSTAEFGMVQAIVWNKRTQRIVGGHQRAKTLDPETETEVVEVDLDEVKEKALNLALNNPQSQGHWTSALGDILSELRVEIPDLSSELRLNELEGEVARLASLDLGEIADVDLGDDPKAGKGKDGDADPDAPNSVGDPAKNRLMWNLEVTFDSEVRRKNALKRLKAVGKETLAECLEELLDHWEASEEE